MWNPTVDAAYQFRGKPTVTRTLTNYILHYCKPVLSVVEVVMGRPCGHFVEVLERSGDWVVLKDHCPECGGTEFTVNDTGEVIGTDE